MLKMTLRRVLIAGILAAGTAACSSQSSNGAQSSAQPTKAPASSAPATSAPAAAAPAAPAKGFAIVDFGPKNVKAGTPFNVQKDGGSAVWVRVNRDTAGSVFVVINGTRLKAAHRDRLISATVPPSLYKKPGNYRMYVVDVARGKETKSASATFAVK